MATKTAPEAAMPKTTTQSWKPGTAEIQDGRMAYIPKTVRTVHDVLKRGEGPFVLDDFEDRDLWSQNFHDKWIYSKKGLGRINVSADTSQAANGTSCSMKIEYKFQSKSAVAIRIGIKEPYMDEKHGKMAYDLSRFNRMTFCLKGQKDPSFLSKPNKI